MYYITLCACTIVYSVIYLFIGFRLYLFSSMNPLSLNIFEKNLDVFELIFRTWDFILLESCILQSQNIDYLILCRKNFTNSSSRSHSWNSIETTFSFYSYSEIWDEIVFFKLQYDFLFVEGLLLFLDIADLCVCACFVLGFLVLVLDFSTYRWSPYILFLFFSDFYSVLINKFSFT